MDRRRFLTLSGAIPAGLTQPVSAQKHHYMQTRVKAILFDGFSIFDPRPVFALAGQLYSGKGNELAQEWRTRQFEYTWLRTLSNDYVDFPTVTRDALVFAIRLLGLEMSKMQQDQFVDAYYHLQSWPDVREVLMKLKTAGYRLGILSDFTGQMLERNVSSGHLEGFFEHLLSVEAVQKYKPSPEAYRLGMKIFHLSHEEILFVPSAGWDAAGSKTFGYPTFWANYMQLPMDELGVRPDGMGKDLDDLLTYLETAGLEK
jgi:2-haloacid dehalogenase